MSEERPRRSPPVALLVALRPRHWIKNFFVFAAVVFSGKLADPVAVQRTIEAFLIFCALSSTVYLLNDIADRESDRKHPRKRARPIAAGELPVWTAAAAALVLGAAGLGGAIAVSPAFAGVALAYLVMNLLYSFGLKNVVILDVMMVSAGFLLRAWGGAVVLDVQVSNWLILCTGLLALFLGFVKRRQELVALGAESGQRAALREYSLPFLDQMIGVVTASTVLAYSLYALSTEVAKRLGTNHLGLTIPFVLFGIFRYLYLVHQRGEGENPTVLVVKDPPLLLNVLLWGGAVVTALYLWR